MQISPIYSLSFYGGNPFLYPEWSQLLIELHKYSIIKNFYFDFRLLFCNTDKVKQLIDMNCNIIVLVGSTNDLDKLIDIPAYFNNVNYIFSVENADDFSVISDFIFRNNLQNVQILPYYTIENKDFFELYVYQNLEDILSAEWSKKNIFSHKILNTNFFGKLTLFHDSRVYANLNGNPLGDIGNCLKEIIYNEIQDGGFWRKTRDTLVPCNTCLYKYICPSPSNYEIVIGKPNLCHVKQ